MEDIRDVKQEEIVDLYIESNLQKCTLVLGTGIGKSKIAIEIIKRVKPPKVLIVVNNTELRDFSWKDEFEKFGLSTVYERDVVVQTYQTVYKWSQDSKHLKGWFIIADEVDFAADVPELSKFFYEFSTEKILGLTGFITESKLTWFEEYLPILYTYSIAEAQEDNLLNRLHFKFIQYHLSNIKDVRVEYQKAGASKVFYTSENSQYDFEDRKFRTLLGEQQKIDTAILVGTLAGDEADKKSKQVQYKIDRAIAARNNVLLNSNTSKLIVNRILEELSPEDKTIIFSVFTAQSDKLATHTYNNKNSEEVNTKNFDDFVSGKIKTLAVCSKINRGVNIDNLNVAILESFYGSDTQATQRLGRLVRLKPDQVGTVYVLLPYFRVQSNTGEYSTRETQQVVWARKMLTSTEINTQELIDWRYDSNGINN